jgi:hypothetical protein
MQSAAAEDLGAQTAAVAQAVFDAFHGKRLQMVARLAQPYALEQHFPNGEFPIT